MIAGIRSLAGVVKQKRKAQQCQIFDLRQYFSKAKARSILRFRQFRKFLDRHQRMLVHCVAVVKVRNHQAHDLRPFRK